MDDQEPQLNQRRERLRRCSLSEVGQEYVEQFGREPDYSLGIDALVELILNDRQKKDVPAFRFPP
jgi:hypothetical protein